MAQIILEGTPQELAPYLERHPDRRFCLIDLDAESDAESPPSVNGHVPAIDAENAAAIALLRRWREEEATDDPEELRLAEEELAEFKRNMNANRASTGERLIYP